MVVHKRCCYYLNKDEICPGHPVSNAHSRSFIDYESCVIIILLLSVACKATGGI